MKMSWLIASFIVFINFCTIAMLGATAKVAVVKAPVAAKVPDAKVAVANNAQLALLPEGKNATLNNVAATTSKSLSVDAKAKDHQVVAVQVMPKIIEPKTVASAGHGEPQKIIQSHTVAPSTEIAKSSAVQEPVHCAQIASVVYAQHIQAAAIADKEKQALTAIWNFLYLGYLVRQSGSDLFIRSGSSKAVVDEYWQALKTDQASYATNPFCLYTALKQSPEDIEKMRICIDTASLQQQVNNVAHCVSNVKSMYESCASYNTLLGMMLTHLDPKTFTTIPADSDGVQTNYATFHLHKALKRMQATCKIVQNNLSCETQFSGDIRDMGVIVNIQNNTDYIFSLKQKSVQGSQASQIGILKPGLNNVNLHTAALQAPNATVTTSSADMFDVELMTPNASEQFLFSIKIMSGTELLDLLRSVSKNKKDIFIMNGRRVAKQYAVDEKLTFLVIVQIPVGTELSYEEIPVGQRIQAFCLSSLSGPFLMTMQINQQDVDVLDKDQKPTGKKQNILQPSFVSVQSIENKGIQKKQLPMLILPQFLSNVPTLHLYWMMLTTAYLAASTDFEFFGEKCFANELMYFEKMGCFEDKARLRCAIDIYSFFISQKGMFQVPGIIEVALYETLINSCSDIVQLAIAQDSVGAMVSNVPDGDKMNINILFNQKFQNIHDMQLSHQEGMGLTYGMPYQNVLLFNISKADLLVGVFVSIVQVGDQKYSFTLSSKKGDVLNEYFIYGLKSIKTLAVDFLGNQNGWIGSELSNDFIHNLDSSGIQFKILYSDETSKQEHVLFVSKISPIDRVDDIHAVSFEEFPLRALYFDLYSRYEVSSITRCYVVENGKMPTFLEPLTMQDWQAGIYIVLTVKNNEKLNINNIGALTVAFYRSDKNTLLGTLTIQGENDITHKKGLVEPVHGYNLGGNPLVDQYDLFLSTAIFLRYLS